MSEGPVNYRMKWGVSECSSNVEASELETFREKYRISETIEMFVPTPDERACYPREWCVAVSDAILAGGMRLPLHPFFRFLLRQYNLAPTQLVPNAWSQMAGAFLLWKEVTLGEDMPPHVFQTLFQPRASSGGDSCRGWYYINPWGSHSPFIWGTPSSIQNWKSS